MSKKSAKKVGNFGFFLAIPSSYIIVFILSFAAFYLLSIYPQNKEKWSLFLVGAISATSFISTSKLYKLRVFIHELKHAIVVILTGNKLQEMKVGKREGHVTYLMYWNKKHFAPLITLSPYFLPLLSAPVLMLAMYFEKDYPLLFSAILGITLAADLTFGVQDLHPAQTDLSKLFGGFFIAGLFLTGMYLAWSLICILWMIAGRKAFLFVFYGLYRFVNDILAPSITAGF